MAAMKDRLIHAAELLDLDPSDLLDLLDPPHRQETPTMSLNPDDALAHIRYLINGDLSNSGYGSLIDMFRDLDAHLSNGGRPPEAWREGPDAPADTCPLTGKSLARCQVSADGKHACPDLRRNGGGWFTWAEYEHAMSD